MPSFDKKFCPVCHKQVIACFLVKLISLVFSEIARVILILNFTRPMRLPIAIILLPETHRRPVMRFPVWISIALTCKTFPIHAAARTPTSFPGSLPRGEGMGGRIFPLGPKKGVYTRTLPTFNTKRFRWFPRLTPRSNTALINVQYKKLWWFIALL